MGITPYYSGAVWMGSDDKNYHVPGLVGGTEAPMWRDIMTVAHLGLAVKQFQRPSGIVEAQVCLDSGKAPTELCAQDPRGSRVQTELFIDGTQPVELCDIHTTANIDIRNGKLATENTPPEFIQQRVFIKRPITPRAPLLDDPYVLPTQYSELSSVPQYNEGTQNDGTNNGGTIDNGSSNDGNAGDDNVNVDNNTTTNTSTNTGTSSQKPPKEQPKKP
jgi:penicillin-binding protein 1A